jgi:hypothetical protein
VRNPSPEGFFPINFTPVKKKKENDGLFIRTYHNEFESRDMKQFMEQVNINLWRQCHIFRAFCPASQLSHSIKMYENLCRYTPLLHKFTQKFSITHSLVIETQLYMHIACIQTMRNTYMHFSWKVLRRETFRISSLGY